MKFRGRLAYRPVTHVTGLSVLLVLYHLGGKASASRVLDDLEKILQSSFEPEDVEPEYRNGIRANEHSWHHRIHAILSNPNIGLRNNGFVLPSRKGERGIWVLTDKGRHRIEALLEKGRDPRSQIPMSELVESLDIPFLQGNKLLPEPPEEPIDQPSMRSFNHRGKVIEPTGESRPSQILSAELSRIREFLTSNGTLRPDDQTLCDWVWFCYKFELFTEGATLFSLIRPESIDRLLYDRTKKLADVCALRKE